MISFRKIPESLIRTTVRGMAVQQQSVVPQAQEPRMGIPNRMSGWELHSYGAHREVLEFHNNLRFPKVKDPKELVVRVTAASLNPIDLAMTGGYGASVLNLMRGSDDELPLRLGRDFCGEIVYKGAGVYKKLSIGDTIWGVVPPHRDGCHAEYVKVHQDHVTLKPPRLSDVEAASIPYAGLTAWSGLFLTADLKGCMSKAAGKKVLVLGGAGGVGTMAIQMCRAENCHVIATGSEDAEELIRSLGADEFINYRSEDYEEKLLSLGQLDVILDCAGRGTDYADAHGWTYKNYVTFSSPLLRNFDSDGLLAGGLKSISEMVRANLKFLPKAGRVGSGQGLVKWAYFVAHPSGMKYLKDLAEKGQLKPVVAHQVPLKDLPDAYDLLSSGHLRGKIVIKDF